MQATFASEVSVDDAANEVEVSREVDGGIETLALKLPAVITCDLRLNVPRFATLPNIMKARKKKIEEVPIASLDVDVSSKIETLKVVEPPKRKSGIIVKDTDDLIDKLVNEAKVL